MNNQTKFKRCSDCGKLRPLTEFYRGKRYKDGHRNICKKCWSKRSKKWVREYREKHGAEVRKKQREHYHKKHPNARYNNGETFLKDRKKALERDNYTCQDCGATENLETHHIDGSGSNVPAREMNNDLDNLITLCHKCHMKRHGTNGDISSGKHRIQGDARIYEMCQHLSQSDVARRVGLTRQRISQIVHKIES